MLLLLLFPYDSPESYIPAVFHFAPRDTRLYSLNASSVSCHGYLRREVYIQWTFQTPRSTSAIYSNWKFTPKLKPEQHKGKRRAERHNSRSVRESMSLTPLSRQPGQLPLIVSAMQAVSHYHRHPYRFARARASTRFAKRRAYNRTDKRIFPLAYSRHYTRDPHMHGRMESKCVWK